MENNASLARNIGPRQGKKLIGERYRIGEELGRGASGRVYKGLDTKTGIDVAVKEISLERLRPSDISGIIGEVELLKSLNHKNVVQYMGSFHTRQFLYIVMELVESGSLACVIKKNNFGPFPEGLVAVYIEQVLRGLAYLHSQGVVHRDIKGANILTNKEGIVKLADFGVAARLSDDIRMEDMGGRKEEDMDAQPVGTPYWMAPEVVELKTVTASSDIWSVGCLAIELLTGYPPYFDLQPLSALYNIVQDSHPPLPNGASDSFREFLLACFDKDPIKRPSALTLTKHHWITENMKKIKSSWEQTIQAKNGEVQYNNSVSSVIERLVAGDLSSSLSEYSGTLASTESFVTAEDGIVQTTSTTSSKKAQTEESRGYTVDGVDQNAFEEECASDTTGIQALQRMLHESGFFLSASRTQGIASSSAGSAQESADLVRQINSLRITATSRERSLVQEAAAAASARSIDVSITKNRHLVDLFIKEDGLSCLRELFDSQSERLILPCFDLLLTIVATGINPMEEACCLGLIPAALRFTSKQYTFMLRIRAAQFAKRLALGSSFSSKLLVACQGIPFLMSLLGGQMHHRDDYELGVVAMETFWLLLRRTSMPGSFCWPNQYLRLMAHHDLPQKIANILPNVLHRVTELSTTHLDKDGEAESNASIIEELATALQLLEGTVNLFVALAHGDKVVKSRCSRKPTITPILSLTVKMPTDIQEMVLRAINALSVEETIIADLEEANAVAYAAAQLAREDSPVIQYLGIRTLKHLCQLSRVRQDRAATSGAIPWLCKLATRPPSFERQQEAEEGYSPENDAAALLAAMVHSSSQTRDQLWKAGAVEIFLQLLKDESCRASVLEALAYWLDCDPERIEPKLLEETAIARIVLLMPQDQDSSEEQLQRLTNILSPISRIVMKSKKIGLALSSAGIAHRVVGLMTNQNPSILLSLMDLLKILYEIQPHPREFVVSNGVDEVLKALADSSNTEEVLVSSQANKLLAALSVDSL